jgi:hypothetical protein
MYPDPWIRTYSSLDYGSGSSRILLFLAVAFKMPKNEF